MHLACVRRCCAKIRYGSSENHCLSTSSRNHWVCGLLKCGAAPCLPLHRILIFILGLKERDENGVSKLPFSLSKLRPDQKPGNAKRCNNADSSKCKYVHVHSLKILAGWNAPFGVPACPSDDRKRLAHYLERGWHGETHKDPQKFSPSRELTNGEK